VAAHSHCKGDGEVEAEGQVAADAVLEADGLGVWDVAAVAVESEQTVEWGSLGGHCCQLKLEVVLKKEYRIS
jgi:hypothetical protein